MRPKIQDDVVTLPEFLAAGGGGEKGREGGLTPLLKLLLHFIIGM